MCPHAVGGNLVKRKPSGRRTNARGPGQEKRHGAACVELGLQSSALVYHAGLSSGTRAAGTQQSQSLEYCTDCRPGQERWCHNGNKVAQNHAMKKLQQVVTPGACYHQRSLTTSVGTPAGSSASLGPRQRASKSPKP